MRSSLVAVCVLLCCAPALAGEVSITYIANEGVLLEGGGKKVAIDALFRPVLRMYDAPAIPLREEIHAASGRFEGVDLVLVSHKHQDHHHPKPVMDLLAASPSTCFISSEQVAAELRVMAPRDRKPELVERSK